MQIPLHSICAGYLQRSAEEEHLNPMSKNLENACEELKHMEPVFHTAATGPENHKYERMIEPDFWEVGASGRRYDRKLVLKTLSERESTGVYEPLSTEDFDCTDLGGDCYLVRYMLRQGERATGSVQIWAGR